MRHRKSRTPCYERLVAREWKLEWKLEHCQACIPEISFPADPSPFVLLVEKILPWHAEKDIPSPQSIAEDGASVKLIRSNHAHAIQSTSAFPPGTPLYQTNASLHELATKIVTCQPVKTLPESEQLLFKAAQEGDYVLTTEDTVFHPQGGGQPSDEGQMRSDRDSSMVLDVKLVRKAAGNRIYHFGSLARPLQPFQAGESIIQQINTATRNYHSRYHTAGHLLSLAVRELKDQIGEVSEVKANHAPGMAFVEFRGLIAGEHKALIQEKANELQQKNLAVEVDWWNEDRAKARCAALPEGFVVPEDGNIRVVAIESLGAYPCGGTHLPTTVDIGGVVVRKISRQKGLTKISYGITDGQ